MVVGVRDSDYGLCPYLEGRHWRVQEFSARAFPPEIYESLLVEGWRRSGEVFYRDACPGCRRCVPIRLDATTFFPSPSQRRVARANADIETRIVDAEFSEERFALYREYCRVRHGSDGLSDAQARAAYSAFLLDGPLGGAKIVEYRDGFGELLATGYVDVLAGGLSSVYFAFDPAAGKRSLGTWSVIRELELARELGKRYYYLGFWVPGSPKMDYKASFRPFEYAWEGSWLPASGRDEVIDLIEAAR
jgi:arginyl-tRNA--protein-N-Asp/Glu arginylyltransferase